MRIARPSSQPPACLDIELKSVFVPCLGCPGAFFGQTTGSRLSIYVSRSQKRPQVPPQRRSNTVIRNPIPFPISSYVGTSLLAHIANQPRAGCPGKQPRASVLRKYAPAGLSNKPAKAVRRKEHPSPVKRSFGGKPTTSVGLASSLDRNYRA